MEYTARRGRERKMLTVNKVAPAAHTSTKIPSYFWPRVISGAAYAGVPHVVLSGSPGNQFNRNQFDWNQFNRNQFDWNQFNQLTRVLGEEGAKQQRSEGATDSVR